MSENKNKLEYFYVVFYVSILLLSIEAFIDNPFFYVIISAILCFLWIMFIILVKISEIKDEVKAKIWRVLRI